MENEFYRKHGFGGLKVLGKLGFILVFAAVGWLIWEFSVSGNVAEARQAGENALKSYLIGGVKIFTGGLIVSYVVHFFLPHKKFARQQFYCADCGEFMGFKIGNCVNPECGSNRYTTDAGKAKRAKRKFAKQV